MVVDSSYQQKSRESIPGPDKTCRRNEVIDSLFLEQSSDQNKGQGRAYRWAWCEMIEVNTNARKYKRPTRARHSPRNEEFEIILIQQKDTPRKTEAELHAQRDQVP
ncbi:hypothetical protein D9M69_520930 [compost metagenome]